MLEIEGVEVRYGPITAVRDATLSVSDGELVALLGANGAGKTTLLGAVAGLKAPVNGSIRLAGAEIAGQPAERIVRAGMALVPEGRRLFPGLTVDQNLRLGAAFRTDADEIAADRERMLAEFPVLADRLGQAAGTLSGGQQQMLAIARGLMSRPGVLLLDEPSLGLAPVIVEQIFRLISELKGKGMAILLVEQNARMALEIADRTYLMTTGSVGPGENATDVLARDDLAAAYLGVGD